MIKRDFHGWKTDDAIQEIHNIVGQIRKDGKSELIELITGRGRIRGEAVKVLEAYGLSPSYKLEGFGQNDGAIMVLVE